jgi:hypothetical protein
MKRKMRKFADGGLSSAQEEWLGGADRTDPYILARMRSAVPDTVKDTYENNAPYKSDDQGLQPTAKTNEPVTKTVSQTKISVTKPKLDSSWENNSKIADIPRAPETAAQNKARMEALTKKQALIDVAPEDYVTPGGMLKGMLKGITSKGLKSYTAREIADMTPKMIGRENLKLGREPLKLGMKHGGSVKKMASGGTVSSASKRADGIATKGKTRGKIC